MSINNQPLEDHISKLITGNYHLSIGGKMYALRDILRSSPRRNGLEAVSNIISPYKHTVLLSWLQQRTGGGSFTFYGKCPPKIVYKDLSDEDRHLFCQRFASLEVSCDQINTIEQLTHILAEAVDTEEKDLSCLDINTTRVSLHHTLIDACGYGIRSFQVQSQALLRNPVPLSSISHGEKISWNISAEMTSADIIFHTAQGIKVRQDYAALASALLCVPPIYDPAKHKTAQVIAHDIARLAFPKLRPTLEQCRDAVYGTLPPGEHRNDLLSLEIAIEEYLKQRHDADILQGGVHRPYDQNTQFIRGKPKDDSKKPRLSELPIVVVRCNEHRPVAEDYIDYIKANDAQMHQWLSQKTTSRI